jgi:protein SCO1/2
MSPRALMTLLALTAASLLAAADASVDRKEPLPPELEGIDLIEHLDAQLPLELPFVDEDGRKVTLGAYFNQQRPVLMVLIYFRCPMLCGPLINGMVEGMKSIPLTPGKDYECVVVSFDPLEGPELARKKKASFLEAFERPAAGPGVHFLTGEKASITALARTIGFGYKWVEAEKMYAHPASLYVCTPQGRLSRYLKGVAFEPQTMRLSLVEAGQGKIGSLSDQLTMTCLQFDPTKGRYSISALRVMRLAGVLTLLGIGLGVLWLRHRRRQPSPYALPQGEGNTTGQPRTGETHQ